MGVQVCSFLPVPGSLPTTLEALPSTWSQFFPRPASRTSCARHRLATEKKGTKSNGKGGGPVLLNVQHHLPIIPAILQELVGFDGAA
jgi:hypothetical protein